MSRMSELVDKLNDYAYRYYVLDTPIIADAEYDKLYDELVKLEDESGEKAPNSPTRRVGGEPLNDFASYKHRQRLYSLAKSQSVAELESWAKRVSINGVFPTSCVEYKYDGLTVNLTYNNGELERATTRGNGIKGEDVTSQAMTIRTIPLRIDCAGIIEIQGECIMRKSELQKYNATHSDSILKNERNAAAGALRNLDSRVTAERNLDFMAYSVGYSQEVTFATQMQVHDFLVKNKFRADEYIKVCHSFDEMMACIREIESRRDSLDYLIDGAVVKIDDMALRNELGYTEKAPRFAIAFKYEAEEVTTIVRGVVWQVSRTGKVNPLAEVDPVELAGATVSRATLNNLDDIERKDIKIGSKVFIRRSNEVIPEILGVAEHYDNSITIAPPKYCPSCGSELVREGVSVMCKNANCPAINTSKLEHFASKDAMNIEGLSEKGIEQLYNLGKLKTPQDFYTLTEDDLALAEGFKSKKIANALAAINKSKKTTFARFIYALGIPNIGKKTSNQLAEHYHSVEELRLADSESLLKLEDFGDIMASCVLDYFANEENIATINALLAVGVEIEEHVMISGVFSGYNVCLTGGLEGMSRGVARDEILARGGKVSESVSRSVNLVVAGASAGSKLDKATKLGIKVISESEFLAMLK